MIDQRAHAMRQVARAGKERVDAEVRLLRPGETTPVLTLPLSAAEPGVYLGVLLLPASGLWLLELRLKLDDELRYRSMHELAAP